VKKLSPTLQPIDTNLICALVRGQGVNNAIADAHLYVETLKDIVAGKRDCSSAIGDYDKDVFTRGKRDIILSDKQMYAYHHWEALMDSPLLKDGYHQSR